MGNSKAVAGLPTSNKGWKPGFFFLKRTDSRGKFVHWGVPHKWRNDLTLPEPEPLSTEEKWVLDSLKTAIGSKGLPYTLPHRGREKAATTAFSTKRSRGPPKKASGEPLAARPLRMREPDEAGSPPRKKRKATEAEREEAEYQAVLQESLRTAAEPNQPDTELLAVLEESARLAGEGDPRPTDEQRAQMTLTEAVEVGLLELSSEDEAAEDRHAPALKDQQAPASSTPTDAAKGALPLALYVDLEGTSSLTAAFPVLATEEAQDAPASAEPSTEVLATEVDKSRPQPPQPEASVPPSERPPAEAAETGPASEKPAAEAAEAGSGPAAAPEDPEAPAEADPPVVAIDCLVLPTVNEKSEPPPGLPKPVTTPVDAEAHRARVEEMLIANVPEGTSQSSVDLEFAARRQAAAEKVREALLKQAGKGPSENLKIGGQAKETTPEAIDPETAEKLEAVKQKALRRLRRLDKQPVCPKNNLPRRPDEASGKDVQASDVKYDLHAFAKEPSLLEREGRPMGPAQSSYYYRDLDASLDQKMGHFLADLTTVFEDHRAHLRETVKEGLILAQGESFKEGMAITDNRWFERAIWAEAEVGRFRNLVYATENAKKDAEHKIFEADTKIEGAKSEIAKAKEAQEAATKAKEAAKQLALEEARREVRDELAGLRGKVLVADAVAADSQRLAEEHEAAANEARREAAEARKEAKEAREGKAQVEALAAELKEEVKEAEAKTESVARRADEAELSLSEALTKVKASEEALAEAQGQLTREAEAKLSLQQALDAATEASAQKSETSQGEAGLATDALARAEATEKALADTRAQRDELEERARGLEASLREANVLAESQQRRAEARAVRREMEGFNIALATVETETGLDFTTLYKIPDSPGSSVDGE